MTIPEEQLREWERVDSMRLAHPLLANGDLRRIKILIDEVWRLKEVLRLAEERADQYQKAERAMSAAWQQAEAHKDHYELALKKISTGWERIPGQSPNIQRLLEKYIAIARHALSDQWRPAHWSEKGVQVDQAD